MMRKWISALLIVLAPAAACRASATDEAFRLPPSSLVLFWAAWCAPCRAEVTDFTRLSAAASPRRAVIFAVDGDVQSRAILSAVPADKLRFGNEPLAALYRRLRIPGPVALPLGLMTDAGGKVCATIAGGATVARIKAATQHCAAAQAASR